MRFFDFRSRFLKCVGPQFFKRDRSTMRSASCKRSMSSQHTVLEELSKFDLETSVRHSPSRLPDLSTFRPRFSRVLDDHPVTERTPPSSCHGHPTDSTAVAASRRLLLSASTASTETLVDQAASRRRNLASDGLSIEPPAIVSCGE